MDGLKGMRGLNLRLSRECLDFTLKLVTVHFRLENNQTTKLRKKCNLIVELSKKIPYCRMLRGKWLSNPESQYQFWVFALHSMLQKMTSHREIHCNQSSIGLLGIFRYFQEGCLLNGISFLDFFEKQSFQIEIENRLYNFWNTCGHRSHVLCHGILKD